MKHIDPHVHCRDEREVYKTTIREVSKIAKNQGIVAIFDMPNTNPPILIERDVQERLKLAQRRKPSVEYFLYVGLTSDEKQIKEAVELARNHPKVVGLKLYTTYLTGPLKVSEFKDQEKVYQILTDLGYRGVLAVHCEKESKFRPELWDPQKPWTHSFARPPGAEIASVKDQIHFAQKAKFGGHLHICHISCWEAIDLVWEAKGEGLNISCGVTPHHILFCQEDMVEPNGLLLKVNPPLRGRSSVKELRKYLFEKRIDWIETDHAPHTLEEKLNLPYLSGVTSLYIYRGVLVWLNQQGLTWPEIEKLTYRNIKKVFGEKLKEV